MSRSLTPEILQKYPNDYFIETGTNYGGGVAVALYTNLFNHIYSIEYDDILYANAKRIYKDTINVTLIYGDSAKELSKILDIIDSPATIFLDAHSEDYNPLFSELERIKEHKIKIHTLLIDDISQYPYYWKDITLDNILEKVWEINSEYKIIFENTVNGKGDLLVARTG